MFRVVSANVNGIRAAARRGGLEWLARQDADAICLQEVRSDLPTLQKTLADAGFGDWDCAYAPGVKPGRDGVAVLARQQLTDVSAGLVTASDDSEGRWIEARLATELGPVIVASTYVHTGEAGTGRQVQKYRFLDSITDRLTQLQPSNRSRAQVVMCGDLNIGHTQNDIKNWRGNIGKAGFLPQEQQRLTDWFGAGWVDTGRVFAGDRPGPYTWWSWRGQAFDNDAGWRIDYAIASRALAKHLQNVQVGRAGSYAERWSDHAALVVDFGKETQ